MGTAGKNWKWTEEQKAAARKPKPKLIGNTNGVKHGLSRTLSYNSWKKMMQRCYNETDKNYKDYGGRGIAVIPRWHNVVNFVEDMGDREKGMSLERIDVNNHYGPANCCWIEMRKQAQNRRPWQHTPEGLAAIGAARRGHARRLV